MGLPWPVGLPLPTAVAGLTSSGAEMGLLIEPVTVLAKSTLIADGVLASASGELAEGTCINARTEMRQRESLSISFIRKAKDANPSLPFKTTSLQLCAAVAIINSLKDYREQPGLLAGPHLVSGSQTRKAGFQSINDKVWSTKQEEKGKEEVHAICFWIEVWCGLLIAHTL